MLLLYLALGGALGTLARFGLAGWIHAWAGTWIPWGTLAVNLIGSFVLGFALRATQALQVSPDVRVLVTAGFCGAFTTFSTYSYETLLLLQAGAWGRASAYALGSLALGLTAVGLGLGLASLVTRSPG